MAAGAGFRGRNGAIAGPARHGHCSRRRAQRAFNGRPRHRQIHAGKAPAGHPATPDPGGGGGDDQDLLHCRAAAAGTRADLCPPLPQPAPLGQRCRPCRRRSAVSSGRVQSCQLRRAVFGRAAGVFPRELRGTAPAAGGRPDHREPRRRKRHLPQPLPAGSRHEPLQMRLLRPPHPRLHLLAQCGAAVPQPGVRPAFGPHRPVRGDGPHRL